ncbi:MAG: enoyl-CoA hydratase/isomerase family protein [Acidimicrobiales bacterium]|nr:enoyl-CoA hydratase/isomerase family protein [Acidimicrobiales bacterium]
MDDEVLVDDVDGVVTITLNRPERKNAIPARLWGELRELFQSLGYRSDVRVVVLTGAGGDFCSGADVGEFGGAGSANAPAEPQRHVVQSMRNIGDCCLALHDLPQPTIARVDGVAAGAGANLALACDLVVASDQARFCEIFAKRGLSVDFGGSWILPRLVGLHKAKELVFLTPMVPADEARSIGLVNKVVPVAELDAAVDEWARALASGPPVALGLSKVMLNQSFDKTLQQALVDEGRAQAINGATADTAEAARAWFDKRDPRFIGR